ncbi:hypothetical protein AAMO2058_000193400 [Amorphochlora amoebiformis]|mmetsp:Transcript_16771/g.26617  ORF Transcript_16771/g.26617 Transcript_16771/m.26617 type:complete len:295 (-) Transcript_16771:410-1294(-)|eukprot:1256497-Amorphochlora_amoeboformis.AAC.1
MSTPQVKWTSSRPLRAVREAREARELKLQEANDDNSVRSHSGTEDTENEFPSLVGKTYDMVDDPRTAHIICWAEDGNGFIVKNADAFCSKILPTYFRTKRFRSFVRNLNMYGFRSRKQAQEGVYRFKHPQFRRGKKSYLSKIRKKTTQKSMLTDLRGSIKELRSNYAKLSRSHARLEGILNQITQVLPLSLLQNMQQQLGPAGVQKAIQAAVSPAPSTSSASTPPDNRIESPIASPPSTEAVKPPPLLGLNSSGGLDLKSANDNLFGPAVSPPFNFDGTQSTFGWNLLNPQALA